MPSCMTRSVDWCIDLPQVEDSCQWCDFWHSWVGKWQWNMMHCIFSNCIISTQLQFLWLEMQYKWSLFSLNIIDFVYMFIFMSISVECHNFIGVTIPKCLLCDVPKSCKLHRLSKFHSLTKNHRYPQVMIHDVPPLATLLESLPVVKICDLDSPSHAFFLEAQKYSDALKSYSRALENLKPFAGDDAWHRIFVKQILESSKKPVEFHLFYIKDPLLNVWFWQKVPPKGGFFVPEIYFWSWQSPEILELAFFVSGATKNAGSKL